MPDPVRTEETCRVGKKTGGYVMFSPRNIGRMNERGALMLEAIALLGLMTMMSPMIVRQTADRQAQTEEVSTANQIKELKKALGAWISANYQNKLKTYTADTTEKLDGSDLAPYLPYGFTDGSTIRGNKLIESYKVSVNIQCIKDEGGSDCKQPLQLQITGVILSDNGNEELDDRRATRIASMVGGEGGYVRSSKILDALGLADNAEERQKILGTQGLWGNSLSTYFNSTEVNMTAGGRIAATTIYSGTLGGDYLYRKKVEGLPDANSMFTDLDMGGNNPDCTAGSGCHGIDNAGGLEVVHGQIVIRSGNLNSLEFNSSVDRIYLTDTTAFSNVANVEYRGREGVSIRGSDNLLTLDGTASSLNGTGSLLNLSGTVASLYAEDSLDVVASTNSTSFSHLSMDASELMLNRKGTRLSFSDSGIGMTTNTGSSELNMTESQVDLHNGNSRLRVANANIIMNTTKSSLGLGDSEASLYGNGSKLSLKSSEAFLQSGSSLNLTSEQMTILTASNQSSFLLNGSYMLMKVNQQGTFSIDGAMAYISTYTNAASTSTLLLRETGLTLEARTPNPEIAFKDTSATRALMVAGNDTKGRWIKIAPSDKSKSTIALYTNSRRLGGSFLQQENQASFSRAQLTYVAGRTVAQTSLANTKIIWINNAASSANTFVPYYAHGGDTQYNRFRVDPAFISVMNDIKTTSRGGARLSEALPNYILKGIYILSNSYTSGPWPCLDSKKNCSFTMPKYTAAQLGLNNAGGGFEFNCNSHPVTAGNGSCTETTTNTGYSYITISYYNNKYSSCNTGSLTNCWAHPFVGLVPAPGRSIQVNGLNETIYAEDEGVCPDGYQAVMTLTPNAMDAGRILSYNPRAKIEDSGDMRYNFARTDFNYSDIGRATTIIQTTRTAVSIFEVPDNKNRLQGWKVAMGVIMPASRAESESSLSDYIWNFGGIPVNSWTAVAQTYCYFNPNRFIMPNMVFKSWDGDRLKTSNATSSTDKDVIMTPADNPLLGNNLLK